MATRKQRRRREKSFRHEYEFVDRDEDGNETPVERVARERAEKKDAKPSRNGRPQPAKGKAKRSRPVREVPPPTWQRAFKRGGLMGVGMIVLFVFVLHSGSQTSRAVTAVIYAVFFIPLTYWADRLAYRTYQRRSAARGTDKSKR
jgi:hypothetical protein